MSDTAWKRESSVAHLSKHALPPAGAFRVQRAIRFSHTDPAGIVYFPVYFDMFNAVIEDWFTHGLGLNYTCLIQERRLGLPVVRAECDFIAPSRLGEMLTLGVTVEEIGRSSIHLRITADVAGEVRLSGKLTVVTTSLEDFVSVPIPEDVRSALWTYRAACGD